MTVPTAWAHLPNAALIDRVLAECRSTAAAWDAVAPWDAAWRHARSDARDAAWRAAWGGLNSGVARCGPGRAERIAAWHATRGGLLDDAWDAARDACAALIAWDDCTWWLDPRLTLENMRTILDEAAHMHPAGVLLLPYKIYLTEVTKEKCK